MPEFNEWFPTSLHGTGVLNVMSFGAFGDAVVRDMDSLGYANLAAAQVDYPSATEMTDTADWCALTECIKHCFSREISPGVWQLNGTEGIYNKVMLIPTGQYMVRKPVYFLGISDGQIIGQGYCKIFNETTGSIAVHANGVQNCRWEQLNAQSAGGTGSIGFELGSHPSTPPSPVNTTGNLFINCGFMAPGGIALRIGWTEMSSEATFIRCNMSYSLCGITLENWNALNYHFLACGGINNELNWLRVNMGGNVIIQNASLAANGTALPADGPAFEMGWEMILGGACAVIGTRTESKRFVFPSSNTVLIGCDQAHSGNDLVFCGAGAVLLNCGTTMGRLTGTGRYTINDCTFNNSTTFITAIGPGASNGAGGNLIKITHQPHENAGYEWWYNGDNVLIRDVVSANTGQFGGQNSVNGVWNINKLTATTCELVGSTYVADTYTVYPAQNAFICPGPEFHKRDILHPAAGGGNDFVAAQWTLTNPESQDLTYTKRRDHQIQPYDAGSIFDNLNAPGEVVLTLPSQDGCDRGASFRFVVLTAQTLRIKAYNVGPIAANQHSVRIFRAGGYHAPPDGWGTEISSNVIGSTLELFIADKYDPSDMGNYDWAHNQFDATHRWIVRAETGTWTISGALYYADT